MIISMFAMEKGILCRTRTPHIIGQLCGPRGMREPILLPAFTFFSVVTAYTDGSARVKAYTSEGRRRAYLQGRLVPIDWIVDEGCKLCLDGIYEIGSPDECDCILTRNHIT